VSSRLWHKNGRGKSSEQIRTTGDSGPSVASPSKSHEQPCPSASQPSRRPRLTQYLSKETAQSQSPSRALHFAYYNFCRMHKGLRSSSYGGGHYAITSGAFGNCSAKGGPMRYAFTFIPWQFALLSCALYLAFQGAIGLVILAAVSAAGTVWGVSGPRWLWLGLNAAIFSAASVIAWRFSFPRL
jgi:hypothetical protein